MICANPDCYCGLFDKPGGSIWLMQLEVPRDQTADSMDYEFQATMRPMKYFWLCPDCDQHFILSRWTPTGVSLAKMRPYVGSRTATQMVDAVNPFPFRVCATPQVEEEFLDVG